MRKLLLPLLIVWTVLLSCAASNKANTALSGSWQLTFFASSDKPFAEIFGQRRPELSFDAGEQKVSGTTGCNRFFGTYTQEQNRLSVGPNLGLTKMACPEYNEQIFLEALYTVTHYRISENQLDLLANDVVLMSFVRQ